MNMDSTAADFIRCGQMERFELNLEYKHFSINGSGYISQRDAESQGQQLTASATPLATQLRPLHSATGSKEVQLR
jgi:hypothetical protein